MRRSDLTLTIALSLSLVLHALVCIGAAERYIRSTRVWLPGLPVETASAAIYVDPPAPVEDLTMRLGKADGVGTAIDASPGERPMIARDGFQDQPFLSRDPVGPGAVGNEPTESTMKPGDGSDLAREQSPPAVQHAFGLENDGDVLQRPFEASIPSSGKPTPASDQPGPLVAADPAPKAESEIDPVMANAPAAEMDLRRGGVDARIGRSHRLTRPRLNLAAKADLVSLRTGNLVLKIRIDRDGNVQHVSVLKSSGSESLDQICKVAAYEWWFEPLHDSSGSRIKDEFPFVIVF